MSEERDLCRWYNETSAIKRAYDQGLIERKWVEDYCWNGGEGCVRKPRFEQEGYVSPDYVLPDGTVSEKLKGRSF
ncbi:MAG: uracil-DNA glycosylase [Armatimonadota bacterium]|nr:uracil-DNA glycosylase [Armatimonadota bacterium]